MKGTRNIFPILALVLALVGCGAKTPSVVTTQNANLQNRGAEQPVDSTPTPPPDSTVISPLPSPTASWPVAFPNTFNAVVSNISSGFVEIVVGTRNDGNDFVKVGYFSFYVTGSQPFELVSITSDANSFHVQGAAKVNSTVLGVSGYFSIPATGVARLGVHVTVRASSSTITAHTPPIVVRSRYPDVVPVYGAYNYTTGEWLQTTAPGEAGFDWGNAVRQFALFKEPNASAQSSCTLPIVQCRVGNRGTRYLAAINCDGAGDKPIALLGYACSSTRDFPVPAAFFNLYRIRLPNAYGGTATHFSGPYTNLIGIIGNDPRWAFDANGDGFQGVYVPY